MPEVGLAGLLLDYPNSGSAVYTRNLVPLLPEVAPDLGFRLFVRNAPAPLPSTAIERLTTPFERLNKGRGIGARLDKLAWESISFPLAGARRGAALMHSLYFAAPILSSAPFVVTIHDVIPLVLPAYHRNRQAAVYTRLMAWTTRRAAAIVTVSHHSRSDIVRVLRVPDQRVHVTYEAVDGRFSPDRHPGESELLRAKYHLPDTFLLYLGSGERRKNIETLVRAWSRVRAIMRDLGVGLVIAARFPPPDRLYPDVPALVSELGLESAVTLIPHVDEEDKPALYRSALAFCFPSIYEGFGFPPLEAMACGTPVLSSSASSLPEVVGAGGWLLPPEDVDSWAEAMAHLVGSPRDRDELSTKGLEQARAFSWRRTAEETVAVYRHVLAR